MKDQHDPAAIASRFINQTGCHIFLTGKAGTGKTTFLKKMVGYTHKKVVVAAPTGIAAINAGGVTLHSLFQLPFGSFVPSLKGFSGSHLNTQVTTPQSLLSKTQLNATKRNLLRELELLIIDEVSMLRADLLDAIDTLLRHVRRKKSIPFGGLQILFIGDLWQLPPVVKKDEWELLRHHYPSLFFFDARALQENPPLTIELENIYRQTDLRFIHLLNHLRENILDASDRALLNSHYVAGFDPTEKEGWVFLTTHNHKADLINRKALDKLKGRIHQFHAKIDGDFNESQYPVEYTLELKEGAQVMFIKNDYSAERLYFNGKIGTVDEISEDSIVVRFSDGSTPAEVEPYTWENKKFSMNQDTNEIEEKVAGTFTHLPLKLAWAITVHKSQGLTFDKAVIDVAEAFASGQTYVALSRLRSLDGLVLTTPFPVRNLDADPSLVQFSGIKTGTDILLNRLRHETRLFLIREVEQAFDFASLVWVSEDFLKDYNKDEKRSPRQAYRAFGAEVLEQAKSIKEVADRFRQQMHRQGVLQHDSHLPLLKERIHAAKTYFEPLLKELSVKVFGHIKEVSGTSGMKKYIKELRELEVVFYGRLQYIHKVDKLIAAVLENAELNKQRLKTTDLQMERDQMTAQAEATKKTRGRKKKKPEPEFKEKKPDSKTISYEMFRQGLGIEAIARARALAESTIEGHLAHFVKEGKIDPTLFVEPEKIEQILEASKAVKSTRMSDVMAVLGSEFTYADIRFALAGLKEDSNEK
ncbi:MAG: helix-turn-helix domain-containing protein [Bacteroides sp.]|jgi:hypothetical protein|nr:helix-turn-helix domain-containing protein [Bacteroides sp.]